MPQVQSADVRAPRRRSAVASFFVRLVKEKPLGFASGMVIVLLLLVAVFGGYVSPYPYNEIHLIDRLQGPSANYLLGTDQAGRDLLSRLIFGARISVLVGLAVTTISIVVSTLIGGVSGFVGGKLDLTVQRFVDAWNAFPGLLLLLTMMAIVGKGLLQIILVMGISGGIGGARVIRGAVIGIKENVYFDVAEAIGSPRWRSLIRHVVPNIMPVIIISFSTSIGGVIMALASLGFLGYGLPPNIPDWGGMLSRDGRKYMELAPRLALWPGLCLTVTIYSLNMFGDAVRDLLDPRLRGGGR
ncbi:MAG: ABC transporter permease [Spirochaetaceae bacterium]|nr:ABC transporter permease [Spirochaetaceae bacterium]